MPNKTKILQFPAAEPTQKEKKPRNLREDGRKQVQLDIGTDPETGKRLRKYFYGKTLKEANEKKTAYIEAQKNPPPPPSDTVTGWVDKWLTTYGTTGGYSTQVGRKACCAKIKEYFGKKLVDAIKPIDIQSFANSHSALSKSSITKLKAATYSIFDRAVENEMIKRNPCTNINWTHSGEDTHRYLSDDEIKIITRHHREYAAGLWAMLMLYAGLRRGEALALRWADIDTKNNMIHVRSGLHFEGNKAVIGTPKTSTSVRDIPLLPPLRAALDAAERLSEYVCTGAQGELVSLTSFRGRWTTYLNTMANIINDDTDQPVAPGRRSDLDAQRETPRKTFFVRPHDLRHTFCSMLYDAGVDLKTAQKIMGHSKPEITMRIYTHLSAVKEAASLEKMQKFVTRFQDDP